MLTASPAAGSTFAGWSGSAASSSCTAEPICTLTATDAATVRATFAPSPVALTLALAGGGGGTVTGGGLACARVAGDAAGGTCNVTAAPGTGVTLSASPAAGSTFAGWSGGGCSGTGACTTTVRQATTVTATFERTRLTLRVETSGAGAGTVTSAPGELACARAAGAADGGSTGICAAGYAPGTAVTLTATPGAGNAFAGWSGAGCSGTAPCVVTMDAARLVTATFVPAFPLAVGAVGTGAGNVVSTPAGIDCARASGTQRGSCTGTFAEGASVTLVATPAPGTSFTGWSGAGCSGVGPCVVAMAGARAVTANFWRATASLTVTTGGAGGGTVSSSPAGIACVRDAGAQGGTCGASFPGGSAVTLSAAPAAGSSFTGWTGACSGTGACAVPLDDARTVGAVFERAQAVLTVAFAGTGAGTVASSPAGVNCVRAASGATNGSCAAGFDVGTSVTLTATPTTPGSVFIQWLGACSGVLPAAPCVVSMTAAGSVSANFVADPNAPTIGLTGVVTGGVYAAARSINLSASDDLGLGTAPFRITWRIQRPDGTQACANGTSASGVTFALGTGGTCAPLRMSLLGFSTGTIAGVHTITVQSVDLAGNVSAPLTVTYTIN